MRISTGNFDSIFFSESRLYELRNLAKMKETTETVCQRNSYETAEQNLLKFCSCEGHIMYTMQMCISTGYFDSIFFLGVKPFFNVEIWPKDITQNSLSAQLL